MPGDGAPKGTMGATARRPGAERGGDRRGPAPASSKDAGPPAEEAGYPEVPGDSLVVMFIVSLLAFMVLTFGTAWYYLDPGDRGVLSYPFLRLLSSAVAAVTLLIAVAAYRKGRSGWWWYVPLAVIPGVNLVTAVWWFARLRDHPKRFGRWTL